MSSITTMSEQMGFGQEFYGTAQHLRSLHAGILELLSHLQETDADKAFLQQSVQKQMASLVENYASEKDAQGLIKRGSYSVRIGHAPDDYVIWGDYFYTEALMRLEKLRNGYWYEGK
ncbi:glycoside hydrolase family 88 protein [Halalkalibacterium halodurans]|nr:glycoside hydrolase family 88 protein [Halalkalibacterium halodurans]